MLTDDLRALWPLTGSYEYAAEVGLGLRNRCPGWWVAFEEAFGRNIPGPVQAQGFAFLRWLETHDELGCDELLEDCAAVISAAPAHLRVDLAAAVERLARDWRPREDPFEPEELFGETVDLWAPPACVGYSHGETTELDAWMQRALTGAQLSAQECSPAGLDALRRAHSAPYLVGLQELVQRGKGWLTPSTPVDQRSWTAALAAAGAVIAATDKALRGEAPERIGLCLARPASHHAARSRGGGGCIINNLAVAAHHALHHGARRVAVIDLDAHHGNGTQDIFYEDERVFTLSVHQAAPFFPGTGDSSERGHGHGQGTNCNLPVAEGEDWLGAVQQGLSYVARHNPQLVLVAFSTDAHHADPASDLQASDDDFEAAVEMIESVGVPVVYELGVSRSERAWVGGARALVRAADRTRA